MYRISSHGHIYQIRKTQSQLERNALSPLSDAFPNIKTEDGKKTMCSSTSIFSSKQTIYHYELKKTTHLSPVHLNLYGQVTSVVWFHMSPRHPIPKCLVLSRWFTMIEVITPLKLKAIQMSNTHGIYDRISETHVGLKAWYRLHSGPLQGPIGNVR